MGPVIVVAVIAGGAWLIQQQGDDFERAVRELSLGRVLVSGLLAIVGTMLIERIWFSLLHGLGARPGSRDAAAVFFVSQLGKYLPGSVWPVVAQMQFGLRWGVARTVMLAANVLLLAMVTGSGIVLGGLLLPWSSDEGLRRYWWLVLLLVPILIGLHPRTVPALIDWLFRKMGREPLGVTLSGSGVLRSAGWALLAWLVLGLHIVVLLGAHTQIGVAELAAATGGFALAWAAGIAFLPAPAGAGVREAIVVLTLAPFVGTPEALAVALASRVLLLLADVLLAAAGALGRRLISAA